MALKQNKAAEAWKKAAEDWEAAYRRTQETLQEALQLLAENTPQNAGLEQEHLVNPGLLYF